MLDSLTLIGDGIAVAAFLALSALIGASRKGGANRRLVLIASLSTALWSASVPAMTLGLIAPVWANALELGRDAGWLWLLWSLIHEHNKPAWLPSRRTMVVIGIMAGGVVLLVPQGAPPMSLLLTMVAVGGLLGLENLVRNASTEARWGLKYLCLGLGAIFAYDLFFHADVFLLQERDKDALAARGFVTALAAPFLAIALSRIRSWSHGWYLDIEVSQHVAFHSVALIASGAYLFTMGVIGFYVRQAGWEWGTALQITFMAAALLLMALTFCSGQLRSRAKVLIRKHFYSSKYDYREEWLRFIRMLSPAPPRSMGERVLLAFADMMDSPAGSLWLANCNDGVFLPVAAWNYHGPRSPEPADHSFARFLGRTGWVIDLDEYRRSPERYPGLCLPDFLGSHDSAWLAVPFARRGELLGFLVLDHSRAPRVLDWEDRDLLKTAACHAASHLAEEILTAALLDAQQLEAFNQRFAFVIHDVKNVVGQMSLALDNAGRFNDSPEFNKDMIETVRHSTNRLKGLLDRLADGRRPVPLPPMRPVELGPLLAATAARWSRADLKIAVDTGTVRLAVAANEDSLSSVFDHLIDNACAAAGKHGQVALTVRSQRGHAIIEIADDGPGMDMQFVETELFRPFRSTKATGWGIGAWQTQCLIRELGGRLEVNSVARQGTTMRVILPTIEPAAVERETI